MRTSGPGLIALGLAVLLAVIAATPAGSGEAAPPQVAGARASVVFHGSRGAPVVALTFDDGWSATQCEKVFDVLRTRRVPATFFPYAWAVMSAPSFWRRLAAAGYPIGNHTVRHVDLTKLHPAARDREIRDARAIIERITNRPTVALLRPPYGAYNAAVLASALAAGYPTVVMWDTVSWDVARGATVASVTRAALGGRNGSIVIMHCGPEVTPRALPAVISGYRSRGFRFVTVPELLGQASTGVPPR